MSPTPSPNRQVQSARDITHPGGMIGNRVMPTPARDHLDPFVVFERFFIEATQGFDTHPHRGFEIVSYMLEGGMVHEDSLGESHTAHPGDAMRITAGSGIEHSELPADDEPCSGLQLWVALPENRKDRDAGFRNVPGGDLPTAEGAGATVTTVVGEGSPVDLETPVEYLDVHVSDAWTWHPPVGWNGFLYVIEGTGTVAGEAVEGGDFVAVEDAAEDDGIAVAADGEVRVAAVAGRPHGDPIVQRGPFVL